MLNNTKLGAILKRGSGNKKKWRTSDNQKKVLLLLLGGVALGLSPSPKNYFKVLKSIKRDWNQINERALNRAIKNLYESKLIKVIHNHDKTVTVTLTQDGKKKALTYNMNKMKIAKPAKWDKKWRLVMFDIPENRKKHRDALRFHLKELGFFEYQKSIFAHPFECANELDYVVEFYDLRKFVRIIVAERLDDELHLKKHFGLLQ